MSPVRVGTQCSSEAFVMRLVTRSSKRSSNSLNYVLPHSDITSIGNFTVFSLSEPIIQGAFLPSP
jgi:hypothetical protein